MEVSRRFDGWILVATLALVSLGALMVYSASTSLGTLARQGLFTAIGLFCLVVSAFVPYKRWARLATPAAAVTIVLLIALLIPHVGTSSNGAQRWFSYKGFTLEPSELAKIALTLYFAVWLSKKGTKIRSFRDCTAPFGLILALVCMLIVIQPDLGTAAVLASAMVIMFFIAGARLEHLGLGIATGF